MLAFPIIELPETYKSPFVVIFPEDVMSPTILSVPTILVLPTISAESPIVNVEPTAKFPTPKLPGTNNFDILPCLVEINPLALIFPLAVMCLAIKSPLELILSVKDICDIVPGVDEKLSA